MDPSSPVRDCSSMAAPRNGSIQRDFDVQLSENQQKMKDFANGKERPMSFVLRNYGAPQPTEMLRDKLYRENMEANLHKRKNHYENGNAIEETAIPADIKVPLEEVVNNSHMEHETVEVDLDEDNVEESSRLIHRHKNSKKKIFSKLYNEIQNASENSEVYSDGCCSNCSDMLCPSYSCRDKECGLSKVQLVSTAVLKRGRIEGLKNFADAVFPLIPDIARVLWVIIEVCLAVIGLILSVATISINQNRVFNILHLILNGVSCVLVGIDTIYTFKGSEAVKKICCKAKLKFSYDINEIDVGGCKKQCFSSGRSLSDILRLILSEAILYPMLICDVFELIIGQGFKGESIGNHLGFALFIISLVSLILAVYIVRIVVLLGVIRNATAVRTVPQEIDAMQDEDYDPDIKKSAVCYQAIFFIHVVVQMLVQVLMYIVIAAKIRYDNRHFCEEENSDDTIHVTGYLWYMIASGYVLPTMGLLTFFIVTYYWSQQYPIGYRLDMLSLFKMTDAADSNEKENIKWNERQHEILDTEEEKREKIDKLLFRPLKEDFEELFRKSWGVKFIYPFKTPTFVIACFVYMALQIGFILCASQTVDEMGAVMIYILNGGGWIYFYYAFIAVVIIANFYAFFVVVVWIGIIIIIMAVIIIGIVAILCLNCIYCGFSFLCCRKENPQEASENSHEDSENSHEDLKN